MNNIDIKEMEKELRKIFRDIEKSLKIQIILTPEISKCKGCNHRTFEILLNKKGMCSSCAEDRYILWWSLHKKAKKEFDLIWRVWSFFKKLKNRLKLL